MNSQAHVFSPCPEGTWTALQWNRALMQPHCFLHTSWDSLICIKICYKLTSMFPCFKTGTVELGLSWSSESFLFDVLFGIQAVAPPPHPLSTFSYHSCCSPSSCSSLKHAELINRPATGVLITCFLSLWHLVRDWGHQQTSIHFPSM